MTSKAHTCGTGIQWNWRVNRSQRAGHSLGAEILGVTAWGAREKFENQGKGTECCIDMLTGQDAGSHPPVYVDAGSQRRHRPGDPGQAQRGKLILQQSWKLVTHIIYEHLPYVIAKFFPLIFELVNGKEPFTA